MIKDVLYATANLRFAGYNIHVGAGEGDERSGQIVTNFLTACKNTVLQVCKEIIGIIIYSFTMWVTPKCPFFPMLEKAVVIAYDNEMARLLLKITRGGLQVSHMKRLSAQPFSCI